MTPSDFFSRFPLDNSAFNIAIILDAKRGKAHASEIAKILEQRGLGNDATGNSVTRSLNHYYPTAKDYNRSHPALVDRPEPNTFRLARGVTPKDFLKSNSRFLDSAMQSVVKDLQRRSSLRAEPWANVVWKMPELWEKELVQKMYADEVELLDSIDLGL
ncbi:MAG: hypothetical protein V2J26_13015 [Pacificimonas sp.]|jgi:hypothetical protein|nr:hypothetical protein [Pacificimonas sp.]